MFYVILVGAAALFFLFLVLLLLFLLPGLALHHVAAANPNGRTLLAKVILAPP